MNTEHITLLLMHMCRADNCGTLLQHAIDSQFPDRADEWRANLYASIWDSNQTYGSILSILSRSLSNV